MLTLGAYVRYVRKPTAVRYLLVVLAFALGLMSKNMLVTLPCVLLLLDYWPLDRLQQLSRPSRLLKEKIPLVALSVVSCAITLLVPEKIFTGDLLPFWLRTQNALVSICIYLRQTLCPKDLAAYYPNPSHAFPFFEVAGSLALLCTLSGLAYGLRKRQPALFVGWFWFVGMLIPVIGLAQISTYAHADRYTYLPQIGLLIAGTWAVADGFGKWRSGRIALGAIAATVLCVLAIGALRQASYWRDSISLWARALSCTRDNARAHGGYANALLQQGRTTEAIAQYREALKIQPTSAETHYNLGTLLLQQRRTTEAITQYREAARIESASAMTCNNLGNALLQQGQTTEAIAQYRRAVELQPAYAVAHYNLGVALLKQGLAEEGTAQQKKALELEPGNVAFRTLKKSVDTSKP